MLRDALPARWAAAGTLSAAIWLFGALMGSKVTLFGNYAVVPLLIGVPLTFAVARLSAYEFD